jgi:hypothetical protein
MPAGRCRIPFPQNNQAALRDERERELCALRFPLLARAVVFLAGAVTLLLPRREAAERERDDAVARRLELRAEVAEPPRRFPALRLLPAEREPAPRARVVPDERELFARVERLRVAADLPRERVERPRACVDRLRLRAPESFFCAVSRLTSLLKRLLESSSNKNARLLSSNFRKKSSQEISSRVSSPLKPGKSIRRIPGSPFFSLLITVEGTPPRSSAHRRISS